MSRIDTLQIHNFKFFDAQAPIKLDGKHLLLFGENGSGKSSIHSALYTLFEASVKDDITSNFKHADEHKESLINIYAPKITEPNQVEHHNAFIKVTTTDTPPIDFEVSLLNTQIKGNSAAIEINQASDFINYKVLYKFQDFLNTETIDLANIFIGHVLPYVNFPPIKIRRNGRVETRTNAFEMYEEIKTGPGIMRNHKGNTIQVYKNSIDFQIFTSFVTHFNDSFKNLMDFININAPSMLQKLGYDIEFSLKYHDITYKKGDTQYYYTPFRIELIITSYLGKTVNIHRPHSFLNEAKITAIAIAIRLTILKKRINEQAPNVLKFIVFDDVMISLDMSNRDKLLNLIFSEYLDKYQVLILTHDRAFFEDAKNFLRSKYTNEGRTLGLAENELENRWLEEWQVLEMYEGMNNHHPIPIIVPHKSYLQKAHYYFKEHIDYNACGNNLRSALEEFIREYLPDNYLKDATGNPLPSNNLLLGTLLVKLRDYYNYIGFDASIIDTLDRHLSRSLNKSSHFNPRTNFFKQELEDTFMILNIMKANTNYPILKTDEQIKLKIHNQSGAFHEYLITLLDDIRLYKKHDNTIKFYKDDDKRSYSIQTYISSIGKIRTINSDPTRLMTGVFIWV